MNAKGFLLKALVLVALLSPMIVKADEAVDCTVYPEYCSDEGDSGVTHPTEDDKKQDKNKNKTSDQLREDPTVTDKEWEEHRDRADTK